MRLWMRVRMRVRMRLRMRGGERGEREVQKGETHEPDVRLILPLHFVNKVEGQNQEQSRAIS